MGSWMNNDGLYLEFGVQKTLPATGGDYKSFGELRVAELTIDLTTLTTTPVIQDDNLFIGTNMFIEQVEVDTEVAATGGTSFSVGTMGLDRTTVDSNTKFVNAQVIASHDAAGEKTILTQGSTSAGGGIGGTLSAPMYVTALAAGTYTAGRVKVRIKYRGLPPITQ